MALPAWLAATVQLPAATKVSTLPVTVQTAAVLEAKDTGRPELLLATNAAGLLPKAWLPGDTKVMVCAAGLTVKVLATEVAGKKLALPAWLAVMVQLPTLSSVALVLATVHTASVDEVNATARPELALATKATGVVLKAWLAGAVKAKVCAAGAAGAASSPPPPPPHEAKLIPSTQAVACSVMRLNIGPMATLSLWSWAGPLNGARVG